MNKTKMTTGTEKSNNNYKRENKISSDLRTTVLCKARKLIQLYKDGKLGGEIMPEDANPGYSRESAENYLYFTLPMALNYQRNSYKLWSSALESAKDIYTRDIFVPEIVCNMDEEELRDKLLKHKVAIQPNKQTEIWKKICGSLYHDFHGDVRQLFISCEGSVCNIKQYIMKNKKDYPYLSGPKILNYWLYVMLQYTDAEFTDRENISVAPDTHVIQASQKLGLIQADEIERSDIREYVSSLWDEVFRGTELCPIDIHTPLWLWSRNKFSVEL